jgi:hypothetical protein
MRMLDKDPAKRWPGVEDAVAAIGSVSDTEGAAARTQLSTLVQPGSSGSLLEKFRTPGSPVPRSAAAVRGAPKPAAVSPVPPAAAVPPTRSGAAGETAPRRPALRRLAWTVPLGVAILALAAWLVLRGRTSAPEPALAPAPAAPAPEVARLDLTPLSVALEPGQRATLRATAWDVQGREISAVAITWESSDPGVATISPGGEVLAVAAGTAQLTARTGASFAAAVVTVARRATSPTVAAPPAAPARRAADVAAPAPAVRETTIATPAPAVPPAPAVQPAAPAPAVRDTTRPIVSAAVPEEPPAPVRPPVDPRPAIERALETYRRAIESRDLAQLRAAYPGLTAEQERSWREFFGSITEIRVTLNIQNLEISDDQARARLAATYEYRARAHQTQHLDLTAALERRPSGWQITAIR